LGEGWEQDPDTLDTWFSSGLWTFSTLGWPNETEDLKTFHPTAVLETGYDIIFFWVARMILMTGFLLNDVPFHTVYLHGLVRDEHGRKLSKSLGNTIDPLEMIAKYGADALRMALIVGTGPGNDSKIGDSKIKAHKLFANKIWNITRFAMTNCPTAEWTAAPTSHPYLAELAALTADVTTDMENFRFYLAGEKLYHYIWHTFADKIIEEAKNDAAVRALVPHILITSLKLLHPFMPYITEELWSLLPPGNRSPLIIEAWPK
jgi:valyl-tRNA synthetase